MLVAQLARNASVEMDKVAALNRLTSQIPS